MIFKQYISLMGLLLPNLSGISWAGALDRLGNPITVILAEGNVFKLHQLSAAIHSGFIVLLKPEF